MAATTTQGRAASAVAATTTQGRAANAAAATPTRGRARVPAVPAALAAEAAQWSVGTKDKQRGRALDHLTPQQRGTFWRALHGMLPRSAVSALRGMFGLTRGHPRALRLMHITTPQARYVAANTSAKGGFGKVRQALRLDGLAVAIKVFVLPETMRGRPRADFDTEPTSRASLAREVAIMRATRARCQPLDIAEIEKGGKIVLVMPAMAGSLAGEPLSAATARNMMAQVIQDVRNCHDAGYMHRDIKPANLLYATDGRMLLHDYGAAAALAGNGSDDVGLGGGEGTARYMAPECVRSGDGTAASDIWSLGLTYAELMGGKRKPFAQGGEIWDMFHILNAFENWQERARAPDGTLDVAALRARAAALAAKDERSTIEDEFDAFFGAVVAKDERLGAYVLEHMLNFDPEKRPSASAVAAAVAGAGDPQSDAAAARTELVRRGALDADASVRRAGLEAYRQAILP